MAQLNYNYNQGVATAGLLRDTAPHTIVARANGEATPGAQGTPVAVLFGYGVVVGNNPGKDAKLPVVGSTAAQFEGVVVAGIKPMDLEGNIALDPTYTLSVLKWGRVWVRVADGLTINYGDAVCLVNSGTDAGKFTNSSSGAIAINAKFIGGAETGGQSLSGTIAPIEVYNQKA
jgi:hypothetical protein